MRSKITGLRALVAKYPTPLISLRLRGWLMAFVLAPACAAVAGPAFARTVFDGAWSVLIITQSGTCDRAYRYDVHISNGQVLHDEHGAVSLQGQVARDGAIRVSVSAGDNRADDADGLCKRVHSRITDDNLWRPTRRAEEHYTNDKLSTRRGAVHSIGWLSARKWPAESDTGTGE